MKRLITTSLLFMFVFVSVAAQNIYIRFNLVPNESGFVTGTHAASPGKPIVFDLDGTTPTDAYLMDAPNEDGVYTKSFTLPAGKYEYQAIYADGTGTEGEKGAWTDGRPFTISEEKTIVFRAKIVNGFIKYLNDAQNLYFSLMSDGKIKELLPDSDTNGDVDYIFTNTAYKGAVQGIIFAEANTAFLADFLPQGKNKYTFGGANGKVRWKLSFNRHTLTVGTLTKLVTLLDADMINTGNGLAAASELATNLGTFSTETPLILNGGTTSVSAIIGTDGPAGSEKVNNLLKIAPADITAKMYYTVSLGEDAPLKDGNVILTTEATLADYQTAWASSTSLNVSEGLTDNPGYVLNVWYETECHGDIVKSAVYTSSFAIDNTPTGIQENESSLNLKVEGNVLIANLEKSTLISLYTISGQLIENTTINGEYSIELEKGVYVFSADGKATKVIIR